MLMRHIKRLFDLAVAVPSVIILFPVLAIIGFLVRIKIGSPVLFRQVRRQDKSGTSHIDVTKALLRYGGVLGSGFEAIFGKQFPLNKSVVSRLFDEYRISSEAF